jgi:integrase
MEFVEPLRSLAAIDRMKKVLKGRSVRDYTLFMLGIYTGLRISDLLKLTVADVTEREGRNGQRLMVRERIGLREKKTKKAKIIVLNKDARSALRVYLATWNPEPKDEDPLFMSSRRTDEGKPRPIGRWQAYQVLNRAAREAGIKDRIGTHTLRKTFGYHNYRRGFDIVKLQQIFNHSSPAITLHYIGFTQDEIDEAYTKIRY